MGVFPVYLAELLKPTLRIDHESGSPLLRSVSLANLFKMVGFAWLRNVVCCAPVPWFLVVMCCIVNFKELAGCCNTLLWVERQRYQWAC